MEPDKKTEGGAVDTTTNGADNQDEVVSIPKKDYDLLNQTLGSLKRELKDLKKPKDSPGETTATKGQTEDSQLLAKAFLRASGLTTPKQMELALSTAKKWGVSVDQLVDDEDFQLKLEKLRTQESNELATASVKGDGAGATQAKYTPEYWIAKGTPPTPSDIPDRKMRVKIHRAMIDNTKSGKKFYND